MLPHPAAPRAPDDGEGAEIDQRHRCQRRALRQDQRLDGRKRQDPLERSDAALAIASRMSFPWPMFGVFRVLPRGLRDALYRFVARNRYRWFGRAEACMVPRAELQERFLD